ncbi:type IV toxin-antitoxin system AbiEi family antitoxin domain-containing protein [Adlercreutzia sp. ZJ141]|uniref:type IV toxin-antitoxin system AbiEi family antitoxin domain-containing protein n=1 Tax=Adlercreutzia sp. ZJ141 TaxID=2709406 RepID=UPI0013EA6F21|nr:type IV toxin-antitoxin system AbiEi family antitoxin domain-containing protein [Adlercreutzia sp. ZJ141]
MTHFDDIYEIAADNYGLVTTAQAEEVGATRSELARWARLGKLDRRGRGLYRILQWVPTEYDRYAEAVALVGEEAFLVGDAVLSMHGLALVNPAKITVATPNRTRKALPEWVSVVPAKDAEQTIYEGIPSQSVYDALVACKGRVMPERLLDAARDAKERGLVRDDEYRRLRKELA